MRRDGKRRAEEDDEAGWGEEVESVRQDKNNNINEKRYEKDL